MIKYISLVALFSFIIPAAYADSNDDIRLIRETAQNYMEAWYEGDAKKMKKTLHKKLAKRSVKTGLTNGNTTLGFTSNSDMISYTRGGYGKQLWVEGLKIEVKILDRYAHIASVVVKTPDYYEYLHMVKLDKGWVIINALYE